MKKALKDMYDPSEENILIQWMEKLFPMKNQGCINFGYWEGIEKPLNHKKRIASQKNLYLNLTQRICPSSKRVLEVGCGRGHGIRWLREKGLQSYGVDILSSQIEQSKREYPELAEFFKVGGAENLPFDDSSFDCIYSLEAAQHFSSFYEFCKESHRALKNEGKILISTYFINKEQFIDPLKKIIPNNHEGFHNALVLSDAIRTLEKAGFKVSSSHSIGNEVFPLYADWQKKQLGDTSLSNLSTERSKWKNYYSGGGDKDHPWLQAFNNGWIDYYVIEGIRNAK